MKNRIVSLVTEGTYQRLEVCGDELHVIEAGYVFIRSSCAGVVHISHLHVLHEVKTTDTQTQQFN
jgi:hypothetical protein